MKTSESIGEISKALAKAQGDMQPAKFDAKNPFFKSEYATLTSIMAACRPALSANGIAIVQGASVEDKKLTVTTMLTHSSGEFISDDLTMAIVKTGPQDIGSAITYARRYSISAMVGIVSDSDDDGESSRQRKVAPKPTPKPKPAPKKKAEDAVVVEPKKGDARTGVQIANQMKKARELLQAVGCKNRKEMSDMTGTLIGRELGASEGLMSLSSGEMDTLMVKLTDMKALNDKMEAGK